MSRQRRQARRAERQNRRAERKQTRHNNRMERRQQRADNRAARAQARQQTRITRQQMKTEGELAQSELQYARDIAVAEEGFDPGLLNDNDNSQSTGGRIASAVGGGIGSLIGGVLGTRRRDNDDDSSGSSTFQPLNNPYFSDSPVNTGESVKKASFLDGDIMGIPKALLFFGLIAGGVFMMNKNKNNPKFNRHGR